MRFWTIMLGICLLGIVAMGQGTARITGRLTDYPSGAIEKTPVKASAVLLTSKSTGNVTTVQTDSDGNFVFSDIPAGRYVVSAVFGCEKLENEVVVRGGQSAHQVNLQFTSFGCSSQQRLIKETVTVSAGEKQTIEQVSKNVDVIDGQEMRDRADFSLVESLRTIPGFRVAQSGGFGRLATIKTRGLRNQDTAVLIDGIRFRDPTAITGDASSFLSDLTLTSVSKVEVLRGSGSSLYGTNAIGGTVDFQTPEAKSGTHGQIGGAFGGLGLGRFRGLISHGAGNGKFGIGAGVSRTVYTKGIDGDDAAHNTNFQTRIDANPFSKTSVSGRIFFSDANVRLNSNPDTAGTLPASNATIINAVPNVTFVPDVNDPDSFQKSRFFSGQFSVNQVINSQLVLSGYYQGLKTKRTNTNGALGIGFQPFPGPETSLFDGQIHTANAHLTWTANGENTVTGGYEFELEKFGNDGLTTSATPDFSSRARQSSHTFYAQELASLMDGRLQLAGGFRAQFFSLGKPVFTGPQAPYQNVTLSDPPTAYTFDGAASYFFRQSGTKLRAHVGNGYRVPSLYERFGAFFADFVVPNHFAPLGAPDLKPEKTIAFDAGIEQTFAKGRARASATYFYTRLTDVIGFGPLPQPDPFGRVNGLSGGGYLNNKGGLARGAEFSIKAKATSLTDVFASYTFTNSDQRSPQVSGTGIIRTLGIPDHQFTLVATQRFKRFWVNFDFLATSTYLAPIFDTNGFTFKTYLYRFNGNRKGDLTAGYTFAFDKEKKTVRVYGTIENVFDQKYFENGFRTAGATARIGTTFGF